MATYRATADWSLKDGEDFARGRYSRGHSIAFDSGLEVPGTASPHVVGNRWAVPGAVDPEQMLVGAINTCHMLSFLHIAREAGSWSPATATKRWESWTGARTARCGSAR